jgi:nitronate monooxygenase
VVREQPWLKRLDRGVTAALALGAAGVQIGTAYLRCHEAHTSELHRAALKKPEPGRSSPTC